MVKRIIIFSATILLLFFVGYFLNDFFIEKNDIKLSFNLFHVYLFHALASLLIYILVELVVTQLPNETGYLYLALTMIKLGLFVLIFQNDIFSETSLVKAEKASLVIPLFIFLITETLGVAKLLNNKQFKQNPSE